MPAKKKAAQAAPAARGHEQRHEIEIGRQRILERYWELANLDPEVTKGNITGQLKALDSLCEELGFRLPAEGDPSKPARQIYRAAWLHP